MDPDKVVDFKGTADKNDPSTNWYSRYLQTFNVRLGRINEQPLGKL